MLACFMKNKIPPINTTIKPPVELPFGWGEGEPPTPDEIIDENRNAEIKKDKKENKTKN